jgi:type I restriction enzyme M protein
MPEFTSEEDVKIKFLLPYLRERGYPEKDIRFNVAIDVHEGRKKRTIYADAIVYTSAKHQAPLILCETKAPSEILGREAREQAISYARLLPQIAPLVLLTNGSQVQVFHSVSKDRVPELQARSELQKDILKFVLPDAARESLREQAKHELFIIDDVRTFKTILKSCHNEIRNNEGSDPTAAFDEMSKLMFCKLYEEKENPRGNRFRLSVFDESMEKLGVNIVDKIFEEAKQSPTYAGLFEVDAAIALKPRTVRKIVSIFENYDLGLTAFDVKGEAFEYFLGDTFTGGLGEYFTPRNVVEFIVEAVDPKIGERIIDPFCGTGGFLIYAFEIVGEKIKLNDFSDAEKNRWRMELSSRCLYGTDWKERTSQACKMNMMVHGDGSSGIFKHDGFIDVPGVIEESSFDLCITNPPFGSWETDADVLGRYELGSGRATQDRVILAVERCLRMVRPGGNVAIVVIDGVLNNRSTDYVRNYIRRNARVRGVVSLNAETFQGYGAGAKTSVLFLQRKDAADEGNQKPVFMAIARNTGLAPSGELIPGNVLPDILLDFREFERNGTVGRNSESWVVTSIGDRLDAEAYAPLINKRVDLAGARDQVRHSLATIESQYASLAEIENEIGKVSYVRREMRELIRETTERERVEPEKHYRMLGVRWWGAGVFVREEKLGKAVKAKTLFRVRRGSLIYNRLFAFKGSFAVVPAELDGCHASGEFPTFVARDEITHADLLIRYLTHALNSPQYLELVDRLSTGSTKTSRSRFFQDLLLAMTVEVPTTDEGLEIVVRLLDTATQLRTEQERFVESVKSFKAGVFQLLPAPKD